MTPLPRGESPSLAVQVLVDVANATYTATSGTTGDRYAIDRSYQELEDPRVFDFLEGRTIRASDLARELDLM
jgi:hypothetical protein